MALYLFLIHLVYVLPSLLLYSLTAYVISRDSKEFRGPFYTILKFSFFVDILSYLSNFCCIWLVHFTVLNAWLLSLNSIPSFIQIFLYFNKLLLHTQNLRCVTSCLHRVTLIGFPMNAERIWEKITVPILIFLLPIGAVFASYGLFVGASLREKDGQVFVEFSYPIILAIPTIVFAIAYLLLTIVPNVIAGGILKKNNRAAISRRICHVTMACTAIQAVNLVTMILIPLSEQFHWGISQQVEYFALPFTRDAYCFSTPWFNLLLNKDVRHKIFVLLGISKEKVAPLSSSHLSDSTQNSSKKVIFTLDTTDMEKDV